MNTEHWVSGIKLVKLCDLADHFKTTNWPFSDWYLDHHLHTGLYDNWTLVRYSDVYCTTLMAG